MNTTFPQNDINIEALENVRTRLFQLQESILFFLRSINPDTTPGTVSWTELHSKFNVLIAKYLHLTNLVNDPHSKLLQSYTVFPNEAPATDQHVQNLSVLLRTKLFPELEQEAEDRIRDGSISGIGSSSAEERKIFQALKLRVAMHDALCQAADEIFENQRDMVHTKVRYESDDDEGDLDSLESTAAIGMASGNTLVQTTPSTESTIQQHSNSIPILDDLAIGESARASSIRYMNDWGGSLHDPEGYTSESDLNDIDEEDDDYFEARRKEARSDSESSEGMDSAQNSDSGSEEP
ncbi:mediator of RNA polymerase II transcription subunit 8 [Mortierella claussenii]|nr:mediator of RNA polymerase II transcription subunit 8 [Mortierella claussenii]